MWGQCTGGTVCVKGHSVRKAETHGSTLQKLSPADLTLVLLVGTSFQPHRDFLSFIGAMFLPLGLRSSYASQHSQLGQELRSAVSPDLHITPIYEGRTYYSPVYRSPNHGTVELQGSQTALYRTGSGGPRSAAFPVSLAQ